MFFISSFINQTEGISFVSFIFKLFIFSLFLLFEMYHNLKVLHLIIICFFDLGFDNLFEQNFFQCNFLL